MTGNIGSPNPMQPLNVGNVVSAAMRLYRSHLKSYFSLAVIVCLWSMLPFLFLVPSGMILYVNFAAGRNSPLSWLIVSLIGLALYLYALGKSLVNSATISRLAFGELVNQPESVKQARNQIQPRMWSFVRVAFQVWISIFLVYILLAFAGGILAGTIAAIFIGSNSNAAIVAPLVAGVIVGIIVLLGLTWFYARLVVAEVPLAVEENINGGDSVARSWELTKASVFRIQGVVIVAFLVTIPIVGLFNYLPSLYLIRLEPGSAMYWTVYSISIITSLIGGVLIMPFWQALKAVIYYDLRSRSEGLGLQLRDRQI